MGMHGRSLGTHGANAGALWAACGVTALHDEGGW